MLPGSAAGGPRGGGGLPPPVAPADQPAQHQQQLHQQHPRQTADAAPSQQQGTARTAAAQAAQRQRWPLRHAAISGAALAFNRAGAGGLDPACIANVVVALQDMPAPGTAADEAAAAAQQAQQAQQAFPSPVSVTGTGTTGGTGTTSSGSGPSDGRPAPSPAAQQPHAAVRMVVYDGAGLQLVSLAEHADSRAAIGAACEVPVDAALQVHVWDSAAGWWLLFPDGHLAQAFRSESLYLLAVGLHAHG